MQNLPYNPEPVNRREQPEVPSVAWNGRRVCVFSLQPFLGFAARSSLFEGFRARNPGLGVFALPDPIGRHLSPAPLHPRDNCTAAPLHSSPSIHRRSTHLCDFCLLDSSSSTTLFVASKLVRLTFISVPIHNQAGDLHINAPSVRLRSLQLH